jgi:hypothetical protein
MTPPTYITGKLIKKTAFHSFRESEATEKRVRKNGIYTIAQCRIIESMMAYTSVMFFHSGRVNKLSVELKPFIALNISITTRL